MYTWKRDEAVKLKIGDSGPTAEKPISVYTMMKETVDKYPNNIAISKP